MREEKCAFLISHNDSLKDTSSQKESFSILKALSLKPRMILYRISIAFNKRWRKKREKQRREE